MYDSAVDSLLSEYDATLAADGTQPHVTATAAQGGTTAIAWPYDTLGRHTPETYSAPGTTDDSTAPDTDAPLGNHLPKIPGQGGDGTVDEPPSYPYDAHRRLLTETKNAPGTANDTCTVYGYGTGNAATEETRKTVHAGLSASDPVIEDDTYTYNAQGRMASAEVSKFDSTGTTLQSHTLSEYKYGDDGIRVEQTVSTDVNLDGDFGDAGDTVETTKYLNDKNNPTGYSQVLEEKDGTGNVTKSYTLGLDIIAQADAAGTVYFLLKDGHGSTRALVNSQGQIVVGQVYRYDAFGNAIGFTLAAAYTSHLYCGEQMDLTGMVYLRERYYSPGSGRFNRLDPWFGDTTDPLTLHKYVYCGGDAINGIDPTGLYDESTHFWTTYMVAISTGEFTADEAYTLAYYAQLPDQIADFDAVTQCEVGAMIEVGNLLGAASVLNAVDASGFSGREALTWARQSAYYLHNFTGGGRDDAVVNQAALKSLVSDSSLPVWQRGMLIHVFGDTYGHMADDGTLFGNIIGHGLVGHTVDYIPRDFPKYRTFVYELYDALGGENGWNNPKLDMLLSTAATLPYTPCFDNDWGSAMPAEHADSQIMGQLAQSSFGYTFPYWPGEALGTWGATDHIIGHETPTHDMVRELFPMIDNARTCAGVNRLGRDMPLINAFIEEIAFTIAYVGIL